MTLNGVEVSTILDLLDAYFTNMGREVIEFHQQCTLHAWVVKTKSYFGYFRM